MILYSRGTKKSCFGFGFGLMARDAQRWRQTASWREASGPLPELCSAETWAPVCLVFAVEADSLHIIVVMQSSRTRGVCTFEAEESMPVLSMGPRDMSCGLR